MRRVSSFILCTSLAMLTATTSSCGGDDAPPEEECPPDLGGTPTIASVDLSTTTPAAGDTIDVTVTGEHLGELEESTTSTGMEEMGEENEPLCLGGHLHVYIDELMSNPIAQQEALAFPVVIPDTTPPGDHTLIVRLHNKDHTIYKPEVTAEVAITVQ